MAMLAVKTRYLKNPIAVKHVETLLETLKSHEFSQHWEDRVEKRTDGTIVVTFKEPKKQIDTVFVCVCNKCLRKQIEKK